MKPQRIMYSALAAAALAVVLAVVLTDHSSALSMARPGTIKTADSSFGRILVDRKGRTLYLFEKDKGGRSACAGQCATFWPPLIASGKATVGARLNKSLLGTTKRSNGTRQVTYAGHPLYRFSLDKGTGQATGQGMEAFGGGWYVVSPVGKKVENEADDQPARGGY